MDLENLVSVRAGEVLLEGSLGVPPRARGVILFAHGSGSSRHSPRNRFVAQALRQAKFATLLLDLLTPREAALDEQTARLRFDIALLAKRLISATDWLAQDRQTAELAVGYFGASTGAAAALVAAAERPDRVPAVVSRGGRPDLAGEALGKVQAATLLVVGSNDAVVLGLNEKALAQLGTTEKEIAIISGASHLFEEPGALEEVAHLAGGWFTRYLGRMIASAR
jgi:pimeloyl-ACP methyl ester carboxylesterase